MPDKRWVHVAMLAFALSCVEAAGAGIDTVEPEAVGFSSERLERLPARLHAMVDEGELAGVVSAVTRHGKVVLFDCYGKQNIDAIEPLRPDAIFRLYSMSKPVTGVAMMILYERGMWEPEDPLSKYIPQFADLKVYAGTDESGKMILVEPDHPPTVGELMTHTAGFTYGFFGDTPVDAAYKHANLFEEPTLEAFVDHLAAIPLLYQPGEAWVYSVSVDVQGYLVEKLSGQSLPEFMAENIFAPLGMTDTGFSVPQSKLGRLATNYSWEPSTGLQPVPNDPNVTKVPGLASGGGGLYSTTRDYLRFALMLANGGEFEGVRILAPSTVELMRANHLSGQLLEGGFGIGWQQLRPGFGYGYDVAVFTDPHRLGSTTGKGTFLWDGAAGTWFWVDPENDIVFVGMIQRMLRSADVPNIQSLSRTLVHQALVEH